MTAIAEETTTAPVETDDNTEHLVCVACDPEGVLAFCGVDMTGESWVDGDGSDALLCVVCADLMGEKGKCPRCGASNRPRLRFL